MQDDLCTNIKPQWSISLGEDAEGGGEHMIWRRNLGWKKFAYSSGARVQSHWSEELGGQ